MAYRILQVANRKSLVADRKLHITLKTTSDKAKRATSDMQQGMGDKR